MTREEVIVVGGGVIGCAVAFALARRGRRVALLERDAIAAHATGAAAGMLTPLAETSGPGPLRSFGVRSLEAFPALVAELVERSGIDPEWVRSGVLRVALSDAEAEALRLRGQADAAWDLAWLDAGEARAAAPGLSPALRGALLSPREAHVRSERLARALAGAAAACGARVATGVSVTGLCWSGGRRRVVGVRTPAGEQAAGAVVLCTGVWSGAASGGIAAELGLALPVAPVRGQVLSLEAPSPAFSPVVWRGSTYLVPRRDGSVAVGATEEEAGYEARVTAEGVRDLLAAATELIPALARSGLRGARAGLRPATPDRLPVIGPVPGVEGLLVATGHFRKGVLLAPVTAELVADLVEGKGLPEEARAFAPERFATARA